MPLPKEQIYTVDDIYNLPEGTRAELIDGQIYYMAPPSRIHQEIAGTLYRKIANYIESKEGSCKVYIAPFAVFLNENDTNYVEPDISVIVSPGSRRMDYSIKLFKYRSTGVREYWIVDPAKNRIMIWNFETDNTDDFTFSDQVKAGIYSDLVIDFSQIQL